jgi:hypothetical protein
VYLAGEDKKWLARRSDRQAFLEEGIGEMEVKVGGVDVGVRVVKLGGHFPGSCRLLFGFPFFLPSRYGEIKSGWGLNDANILQRFSCLTDTS